MLCLRQLCNSGHLLHLLPPNFKVNQTPIHHCFSTLSSLLNLCNEPRLLKQVHARCVLHGHHQNPSLSSQLLQSYADLGLHNLSLRVLNSIPNPTSELCCRVLRILGDSGKFEETLLLYETMVLNSTYPDELAYPFVLRSSMQMLDANYGRRVHGHLVKLGFYASEMVIAALAEFYSRMGEFDNARQVLDEMPVRGSGHWNSLIAKCLQNGSARESFVVFKQMMEESLLGPDSVSVINLLRASTELNSLKLGKLVHGLIVVTGLTKDLIVNTALLTLYSKLGCVRNAGLVFEKMPEKDRVVWNLMISTNSRHGHPTKSVELLVQMGNEGIRIDLFTALAVTPAIGELRSLEWGKQFHASIIRSGSDYQTSVLNALIDMYSKCDSVEAARKVFELITEKTDVTWASMIKGYVIHGQYNDALSLFVEMKLYGSTVDSTTLISVLPACVNVGAMEQVKYIHGCAIKYGLNSIFCVQTELLVSYAKCGSIDMARMLFDEEETGNKDIVTWNSMISAYAKHGEWQQCFSLYEQMKRSHFRPDSVTFLGLLTACVNSGQVREGQKVFNEMTQAYGCHPSQEHYACMVDLFGRAGLVSEASKLIDSMPFEADSRVWGPLMSACKMHSETGVAEVAAEKLIALDPTNAGNYVLLSNYYAAARKWDKVAKMRSFLRDRGLKKTPGCSWLEVGGKVHEFRVADRSHPMSDDIYSILQYMEVEIEDIKKAMKTEDAFLVQEIGLY